MLFDPAVLFGFMVGEGDIAAGLPTGIGVGCAAFGTLQMYACCSEHGLSCQPAASFAVDATANSTQSSAVLALVSPSGCAVAAAVDQAV